MTSQGVKFKAQNTKLRISLVIIGQSTLSLPSLLHPKNTPAGVYIVVALATNSIPDLCSAEMIIPVFDIQQRLSGILVRLGDLV